VFADIQRDKYRAPPLFNPPDKPIWGEFADMLKNPGKILAQPFGVAICR